MMKGNNKNGVGPFSKVCTYSVIRSNNNNITKNMNEAIGDIY